MWKFDAIRNFVINKLTTMGLDSVQKLEIQQKFDIDDSWAVDAFDELCTRRAPLSVDETLRVGVEAAVRIAHAREQYIKRGFKKGKVWPAHCDVCRGTIIGIRCKCSVCPDYDMVRFTSLLMRVELCLLCRKCHDCYHDDRQAHPANHDFYCPM
jgi:hypothetical protein